MSVEVCLANSGYNNSSQNKDLKMPVVSQRRSSTSSTSTAALTGSYRSTSSLDRPYYNSSTASYTRSTLARNLDSKRIYSRHTSISEDSGVGSSRTSLRSERESSIRRETSRDSGLSLTGRRISSIQLANSVDDIRQKYSPSNYVPNLRKPENKLEINRAKSIINDIGKPPTVETSTKTTLNESRLNLLSQKNKVIVSNDNKMPVNSLSVATTNYNRKISEESDKTIDNNKSNDTDWKRENITDDIQQQIDDDNNGNVTQQSVSEIRKIFDSPAVVGKLTSVIIPPFLKNGTNSGKYEIAQVNKANEINTNDVTTTLCTNLSKLSNKSNNSQNNGNNVRWAFLSSSNDMCEIVNKGSTSILNIEQPSTSTKDSNHTSNFASYIPVNVYETQPVGDILTEFEPIDEDRQEVLDNSPPSGDKGILPNPIFDMSRDKSHDFSTSRRATNRIPGADKRYLVPAQSSDLSTSPRLNRTSLAASNGGGGSATISALNRSSLHREEKTTGGYTSSASKSDKNVGLNGLKNIGNTCFMNSVIQCLSNTRWLLEYLRNSTYLNDINTSTSGMKGALVKAFANVIQELWGDDSDKIVNPSSLKYQIQHFAPRFMGYAQQDAQEFLRYLLEGLHEDVNRVKSKPPPILTEIDEKLSDSQKSMEAWNRYLRIDDSNIVDIFVGQLKSTLKCSVCGYCSVTFDPFWDLSLPIGSSNSITQCLENFTREEVMDGHEKPTCSKCQTRRKCTKSFSIQKFPKILVLHLKRFSPNERFRGKLTTLIDFPLQSLDLSAFAANRGTCSVYNLYAVSNHSGTTYSGHYTAYCKHPYSSEWHEYNDSRVSSISSRNVVSSEAYVLFYELSGHSSHL